jgi:hypothetical protein
MNKKSEKMEKLLSPTTTVKLYGEIPINKTYTVKTEGAKMQLLIDSWTDHFKNDKWPLTANGMVNDLFYCMFGVSPIEFIVTSLEKRKVQVGIALKENLGEVFYIDQKPKKSPAKKGKKK